MNIKITPDLLEQIHQQNDIHDVIKSYGLEINHEGKTCCPFHEEITPSLQVYEDNYYCYGCGAGKKGQDLKLRNGQTVVDAGSDVIAFVQNFEDINFKEAVMILAQRAGIPVEEYKPDPEAERLKTERTDSNRYFYNALRQDLEALEYLYDRGLDNTDIAKWRIGMVPWDYHDKRFKGRIAFGITDIHYQPDKAKTIALAYRSRHSQDYAKHGFTPDEVQKYQQPKYRNDPESKIYKKSQILYGLNEARLNIRRRGYAVIMEGYMDVIVAHKYGLDTSVASCGTSITEEQVKILRRYTDQVFLWMDGDKPGMNGMMKALPMFLKEGFKTLIVQSPGHDPAEIALSGQDMINFIKANAKPALQLVIDNVVSEYDKVMNRARVQALEELIPILENVQRPAEAANYKATIQQKLGVQLP